MLRRLGRIPRPEARAEAEAAAYAYATRLLAETREEVNKADAKAQVLLGIAGVGLGAVTGGLIAGSWTPFRLADSVEWLWWTGAVAALASLACLAGAVYPRTGVSEIGDPRTVAYYGDVVRLDSVQALVNALVRTARPDLRGVADQVRRLSRIVDRKYRLIRWGFWLLSAAVGSTIVSVLLDLVLR
ncbi:Pycsar system effector family protein [Sphaerisporangium fuscum]|uniref:Pycsar system effector family protein n=1 Tax=Sphaerisporangium fuscum TaxID=2835868 RepID=UPI001BDD0FFF|nr:Pycsar system effector family protein [Sphaerisporangium fuscum]